jgi:hypothetical protein
MTVEASIKKFPETSAMFLNILECSGTIYTFPEWSRSIQKAIEPSGMF